jgi:hypothetical protein
VGGVNHKTGASPGFFGGQKGFDVRESLEAGDSSPRVWAGMMGLGLCHCLHFMRFDEMLASRPQALYMVLIQHFKDFVRTNYARRKA